MEMLLGILILYFSYNLFHSTTQIDFLLNLILLILLPTVILQFHLFISFRLQLKNLEETLKVLSTSIREHIENSSLVFSLLQLGTLYFSREKTPHIWLKTLYNFKKKFWVLTYVSEGWDQPFMKVGIEIQKIKIKMEDADVRRIFVINDK